MIEKAKDDSSKYLQKYGGPEACVALIEREQIPVKLAKMVKIIDNEMGVDSAMDVNTYMQVAQHYENEKTLVTLAGYSHLLLAEKMVEKKYSKKDINFELDKACALLDLANRGGNHPYLPRAMKLKRKVNRVDFTKLIFAIILICIVILIIAWLSRFIYDNRDLFV